MIAILNYGVGNLFSISASLKAVGADVVVTDDKNVIENAKQIVLPGVGAFGDAFKKLSETGLIPVIKNEVKKGKPLLGVCLGMQLLFDKSFEYGCHEGLGLVGGVVDEIQKDLTEPKKIPHMGWNSLDFKKDCPLFKYINDGDYVYYVHSYYAKNCQKFTAATSFYGIDLTGVVQNENVFGAQFHPEKSGETGLKILKAFCEL